jgi:predicted NUDIX family phosphoesterase
MERDDVEGGVAGGAFLSGILREIEEECGIGKNSVQGLQFMGTIYSNDTPVDRVHLGAAYIASVTPGALDAAAKGTHDGELDLQIITPAEFSEIDRARIETWSLFFTPEIRSLT